MSKPVNTASPPQQVARAPRAPSGSRARPGRSMRPSYERALADRVDRPGRWCGSASIDHDAAALADGQAGGARQLVARADAGREHDHVDLQLAAVGEAQRARRGRRRRRSRGWSIAVCTTTPSSSMRRRSTAPPAVVELQRHQARRELDDVHLQPQLLAARRPPPARAGRRRSRRRRRPARAGRRREIASRSSMRAVDEAAGQRRARDRRHERRTSRSRARRRVVRDLAAVDLDDAALAVDAARRASPAGPRTRPPRIVRGGSAPGRPRVLPSKYPDRPTRS